MKGRRGRGRASHGSPNGTKRLTLAGFLAIAVAFGPARNGYGLFMPEIREEFGLSTGVLGLIASAAYAGYLAALLAVGVLASRAGPRLPVIVGGLCGAGGMALVAFSHNPAVLTAGVVLAAASAGWSWPPYNDAAERAVPARLRARVLSVISTGTTFGIAAAGLTALAVGAAGGAWRAGWLAFSAAALVALAFNAVVLPGKPAGAAGYGSDRWPGLGWFSRPGSAPLFAVAFSFGAVSSVYWAFAIDHVSRASGAEAAPLGLPLGPLFFVVVGLGGTAGLSAGDAMGAFGLRRVLAGVMLCAALAASLLGVAPGWWPAAALSALLFGAYVMTISALVSVWSSLVFPERPSAGFSAALISFAAGSILAPAAAGALAAAHGLGAVFVLSGAVALLTPLAGPRKDPRPPEGGAAG